MKSNFLGPAYTVRALPLGAQTCINLFTEQNETGNGQVGAFYGSPGLKRLATIGTGPIRALAQDVDGDYLYVVSGASVYKVAPDWTSTLIGTISTATGPVKTAINNTQIVFAHSGGWSVLNVATGALVAVTSAPTTVDISFIDNYGVFANDNGTYGWTPVADFSSVPSLNFASAEGSPDRIIATIADHRELWLFGDTTVEVAVVSSDPDLPFTRTSFIEQGILAPLSATKQDNSVFWLGKNEFGRGIVYRAQGYTPQRISTYAIEQWIAKCANPQYAQAFTYQQDGHHRYVLSFEEGSWCFDINTGEWSQLAYRVPATGELQRHRANCHAMFNGVHVVGDYVDGRIYALDQDTCTDDGDLIYRERAWPQADSDNKIVVLSRGELIAEMGLGLDGTPAVEGVDPQVWLSMSKDGCHTWTSERARSLGRIGEYTKRAQWFAIGSGRQLALKLRTTSAAPVRWLGFNIDGMTGR